MMKKVTVKAYIDLADVREISRVWKGRGKKLTIAALTANKIHGGRSHEVSKRWLGSQRSLPKENDS
jgi:hypothetical protein